MRLHLAILMLLIGVAAARAQTTPYVEKHLGGVLRDVAFSADASIVFVACQDKSVAACAIEDGKELFRLPLVFSPHVIHAVGPNLLAIGGGDGAVTLWDWPQRKQVAFLARHRQAVQALAVSADGKFLASGAGTSNKPLAGEVKLFDLKRREEVADLPGHHAMIRGLAFSPESDQLASADNAGQMNLWNVARRSLHFSHRFARGLRGVSFLKDGKHLAAVDALGQVYLLDRETLAEETVAPLVRGPLGLCASPLGNIVAAGGYDGSVQLQDPWRIELHAPVPLKAHAKLAFGVAFSPDGKRFASVGADGKLFLYRLADQFLAQFSPPPPPANALKVSGRSHKVRVAILASQNDASRNLQDLAAVELSGSANLALLDRTTIARLLDEQKLSLSGVVDGNLAVQAGRILAVDVLATIEHSADLKQNRGITLFDASTGVRLADQIFSSSGQEVQAKQTAQAVRMAVERWRQGYENRPAICLFTVRNADLPRSLDGVCNTLAAMLERQLMSGDLAILERKRLDQVNREKNLAEEASHRVLLSSLTLLDLQFSRSPSGKGIRASVALRSATGKELHRLEETVEDPNATGLLIPLADKILATLKTTAAGNPGSRKREARLFLHEAQLLWKHKHYEAGLQAAEAAFALHPADDMRLQLTEYQLGVATEWLNPGGLRTLYGGSKSLVVTPEKLRAALALAQRAIDLIETTWSQLSDPTDRVALYERVEPVPVADSLRIFFNKLNYLLITPADAEATRELEAFQHACLENHLRHVRDFGAEADRNVASLQKMVEAVNIERITFLSSSPAVLLKTHAVLAELFLEKAAGHPPENLPLPLARTFGNQLLNLVRPYQHKARPSDPGPYVAILERATKDPHPLTRTIAKFARQRFLVETGHISKNEAMDRQPALLQEAKALIVHPPLANALEFRKEMYGFLNTAIGSAYYYPNGYRVICDYFDVCEFMLQRKDLDEGLVRETIGYGFPKFNLEYAQRSLALIERSLELLNASDVRVKPEFAEGFKFHMNEARRKILTERPELAQTVAVWDRLDALVQASNLPKARMILKPMLHESWTYFFTGYSDFQSREKARESLLRFYRVPVRGGQAVLLGEYALDNPPPWSSDYVFWAFDFLRGQTLHRDTMYLGTREGILAFPLHGGKPRRYAESDGLPSLFADRLAVIDEQLIAGLEGGFIVAIDLKNGTVATLASSRRNEKLSPFDNSPPFKVTEMRTDPARQRVLFTLGDGIWEYRPRDKQFKNLVTRDESWPETSPRWGPLRDDRLYLLWSDSFGFHKISLGYWDLARNRYVSLLGAGQESAGVPHDLSGVFGNRLLHDRWIWLAYPFGRHSLDRKTEQFFPHIVKTYAGFTASEGMDIVSPDEILLASREGIYLMRLKADDRQGKQE